MFFPNSGGDNDQVQSGDHPNILSQNHNNSNGANFNLEDLEITPVPSSAGSRKRKSKADSLIMSTPKTFKVDGVNATGNASGTSSSAKEGATGSKSKTRTLFDLSYSSSTGGYISRFQPSIDLNASILANQMDCDLDSIEGVGQDVIEAERIRRGVLVDAQRLKKKMLWHANHHSIYSRKTRFEWVNIAKTDGIPGQYIRDEENREGLLPWKCFPEPQRRALLERSVQDAFPTYKDYRTGWLENQIKENFKTIYNVEAKSRAELNAFMDKHYYRKFNDYNPNRSPDLYYAYPQYGWLCENGDNIGFFRTPTDLYLEYESDETSRLLRQYAASYKCTAPPRKFHAFTQSTKYSSVFDRAGNEYVMISNPFNAATSRESCKIKTNPTQH